MITSRMKARTVGIVSLMLCCAPVLGQGGAVIELYGNPAQLSNGGGGQVKFDGPVQNMPSGTWVFVLSLTSSGSCKFTGAGRVDDTHWQNMFSAQSQWGVADILAIVNDTACTFTGTVEFLNNQFQSIGSGTVEPVTIGVGSDTGGGGGTPDEGFGLTASEMCPEPGEEVDLTTASEDPSIVSYKVGVLDLAAGDAWNSTIGTQSGAASWTVPANAQAGDKYGVIVQGIDSSGQVVATRSLTLTVGAGNCGEGEDLGGGDFPAGGNDGGAAEPWDRCQADIDCWCRGIKPDDSFWVAILKRVFVPCPCTESRYASGALGMSDEVPMCRLLAQVRQFLSWGPFGLISDLAGMNDVPAGTKLEAGLPIPTFGPGGAVSVNSTVPLNFAIVTGSSGWSFIRGLMGLGVYVAFALLLANQFMPKQVV